MGLFDSFKKRFLPDVYKAEQAKQVAQQQRQNLVRVSANAVRNGNPAQKAAAQRAMQNKSFAVENPNNNLNGYIRRTFRPVSDMADSMTIGAKQMGTGLAQGWSKDVQAANRARNINQNLTNDWKIQAAKRFATKPTAYNQRVANNANLEWAKQLKRSQIEQGQRISDLDPIKNAAAIADVGFTVGTASMGGLGKTFAKNGAQQLVKAGARKGATEATKQAAAKAAAKLAGETIPRRMLGGAMLAAPSGAVDTYIRNGKQGTAQEALTGAGMASLMGAGFPLAMTGASKLFTKASGLPDPELPRPTITGAAKTIRKGVQALDNAGKPTGEALQKLKLEDSAITKAIDDKLKLRSIALTRKPDYVPILDKEIDALYKQQTGIRARMSGQGGFVANPFYKDGVDGTGKSMSVDPNDSKLEALKQEARKYKSAEEFVNSKVNMYHGTPYDFDRFDSSKIMTGEAENAMGRGLYMTDSPNVADYYKRTVTKKPVVALKNVDGTDVDARTLGQITFLKENKLAELPKEQQVALIKQQIKAMEDLVRQRNASPDSEIGKLLASYKNIDPESINVKKYNNRVVRAYGDNSSFIDTKAPLSNQQITKLKKALGDTYLDWDNVKDGQDLYFKLARKRKNPEKVLSDAGIKGIKYPVGELSAKQYGGSNYVFFDDKDLMTDQQLTDLYNQATAPKTVEKTAPTDTLKNTANKFKNKDEFIQHYVDNQKEIPITKEYNDYFKKKDTLGNEAAKLKRQWEAIESKYYGVKDGEYYLKLDPAKMTKAQKVAAEAEWAKGQEIYKKYQKKLSEISFVPLPDGTVKTIDHIGEKGFRNQLSDLYDEVVPTSKPTLQDALDGKSTKVKSGLSQSTSQSKTLNQVSPEKPKVQVKDVATQPQSGKNLKVEKPQSKTSYSNNTTLNKRAYKETFGLTDKQATKDFAKMAKDDPLKKAVGAKPTKEQARLLQGIKEDDAITKATREAQRTGKEFNFYGATDKNGRSVGIGEFKPNKHRIEGGLVVDKDGIVLGNHIKIDETGTAINVGGKYTKMDDVFGDITKWKSQNKYTSTLERNIMEAAPDEETGRKAVNWLVGNKTKAERKWKEAIGTAVQKNDTRYKAVMKGKPSGVSKKQVLSDAMDYGEAKLSKSDLNTKYGKQYAKTITDAIDEMRADYDKYIKDINDTRIRFGQTPIEPRKDYITHISELNNNKNFVGDLTTSLKNSITGEAMEKTRGGVPASISGRTEGFEPTSKWNQFLQRRKGGAYEKDPFKAFNEYVPNAEHNIHMTESISRARAAEEFLRARSNLAELDGKNYGKLLSDEMKAKVTGGPQDDKLVSLFQEYANALAGKTQKLDRAILDSPLRTGLKAWQGLQRIGGRATILGNVSSVLMQPLNQVNVMAKVKPKSYAKGIAKWLSGDDAIKQSNFVQARVKHIDSTLRGKGQKFMDATGVPLRSVEEQSVKIAWYANYEDVLRQGYKGKSAVLEADRLTERAVAGRGLADKPEAYRSTAINGLLQYTLEVMAQAQVFWKDLTPTQKAKWIAGAYAINTGFELVMNDRPLPDYIDAVYEGMGIGDAEDERSVGERVVNTGQRALGETVKFNPIYANAAQFMLPKDTKTTLFGSDSDLTRFDGTAAPIRVVQNAYRSGKAAIEGNVQEAISRGLRLVPTGNQIQKTGNSAVMNARGYAVDKNGKPTFDAPTSPVDKTRSYLFGPYATDSAQNYYNEGTGSLAKRTETSNGKLTLEAAQENARKQIANAFGKEYAEMGVKERKELAKTDDKARQAAEIWNNTTKAFGAGADTPEGLPNTAAKILDRASRTTNDNWGNMRNTEKEVADNLNSWLPNKVQLPTITNEVAKKWAEYEKKRLDGTMGKMEAETTKKDILKDVFNAQLTKDQYKIHSMSKSNIENAYNNGLINDDDINKALEVEKQLYDAGLISSEGLAKKLGLSYRGGSGGRGGSGRSGKKTSSRKSSGKKTPLPKFTTISPSQGLVDTRVSSVKYAPVKKPVYKGKKVKRVIA